VEIASEREVGGEWKKRRAKGGTSLTNMTNETGYQSRGGKNRSRKQLSRRQREEDLETKQENLGMLTKKKKVRKKHNTRRGKREKNKKFTQ